MKFETLLSSVWSYEPLREHFFRLQSIRTMNKLIDSVYGLTHDILDDIENYCEENCLDSDTLDEMLYNESVEDLANEFGLELMEKEEEEEEEE